MALTRPRSPMSISITSFLGSLQARRAVGWDGLYVGYGAWLHCSLVKHSPEPRRGAPMWFGGEELFGGFFLSLVFYSKGAAESCIHKSSRGHKR